MSAPVITSSLTQSANTGESFSYQITASNTPTSYAASGLPSGVSIDTDTGLITGIPVMPIDYTITLSATNADGTGTATLTLSLSFSGSSGSSYRAARHAEFAALVQNSVYGTSFTYLGNTYTCIADPQTIGIAMQQDSYRLDAPCRFDMWATEADNADDNFEATGMQSLLTNNNKALLPVVTYQGVQFQIHSFQPDPKQPTVILFGSRKQ